MKFRKIFPLLFISLFLGACGVSESPQAPVSLRTVDPGTVGSLVGVVTFVGDAPAPTKIPVANFSECANPAAQDADVQIRDGKVRNAFVAITRGLESYRFEDAVGEVTIDQHGCVYEPRVVGLRVGQTLAVKNSDPALHNVRAQPKRSSGFNVGMPAASGGIRKTFTEPEVMVPLRCDVHPWMRAYVGVLAHPYFAVTGVDGFFTIRGVPPGEYTLTVWHERLEKKEFPVSLKPNEEKNLVVSFSK